MKKNELKLNELEKKQRENESAYAKLQKELDVKSIRIDSEETFYSFLTKQMNRALMMAVSEVQRRWRNYWQKWLSSKSELHVFP